MRLVTFRADPPAGGRWADGCFEHLIGTEVPWTDRRDWPNRLRGVATIIDVWVDPDGDGALVVAELNGPPTETTGPVP